MSERTLPDSAPRVLHKANLDQHEYAESDAERPMADLDTANVASSLARDGSGSHYPVLDLDVPAVLVPSSTPGHSHLYIDHAVSDEAYWQLCDALAAAGILEPGYVSACRHRGYTSVRLPWVRKPDSEAVA